MRHLLAWLVIGLLCGTVPAQAQLAYDETDFLDLFGTVVDRTEYQAADLNGLQALADLTGENQTWDFSAINWSLVGTGTSEYIAPPDGQPGASDARAAGAAYAWYIDLTLASGTVSRRQTWTYHGLSASAVDNYGAYVLADGIEEISFYDDPILGMPLPATFGSAWGPDTGTRTTIIPGLGEVDTNETYTREINGWGTLITPAGSAPALRLDSKIEIEVLGFVTTTYAVSFITKTGMAASIGLNSARAVQSGTYVTEARDDTGGTAPTDAPVLATPTDAATDQPTTLGLTWNAVADATQYTVDVAADAAFATLVATQTVTGTSATIGPLSEGTVYFWRVRAENDAGAGPFSATASFTTETSLSPPAAVLLNAPADGATAQPTTLDLSWTALLDADDYTVEVATDAAFATIVESETTTNSSATIGPLANGAVYFWRVRASNAAGAGPFSATASFATVSGVAIETLGGVPTVYALHPNYPNPFNPSTLLRFDVPQATAATLAIYDALGRRVATLVDGPLAAGQYAYRWDATGLPGGLYVYRLRTSAFSASGTMVLLK